MRPNEDELTIARGLSAQWNEDKWREYLDGLRRCQQEFDRFIEQARALGITFPEFEP